MLDQIHTQRSKIAVKHQIQFTADIDNLNDELKQLKLKHPYELTDQEYLALLKRSDEYCHGGCATSLKATCDDSYLYRYTTVDNLTKSDNWENPLVARDSAFEVIKANTTNNRWYPLSSAMNGFYKNRRGFSWWTNEEPDRIEKLFRLGLVSDWIMPQSLIMRTKVTSSLKAQLNIPSAIDGYDQPIFLPRSIDSNVFTGQTLNLNDLYDFKDGCVELIINELNVSNIEVRPLELDVDEQTICLNLIERNLLNHYNRY